MSETPNKFSPEVRARAVRPAPAHEGGPPSRRAAVASISAKIGRVPQTLHERVKKAEAGNGKRSGVPTDAAEVLTAPERGNRELRQAGGIVRVFAGTFGVYGTRKVRRPMTREGVDAAGCTVERPRRDPGLKGVIGGKPVRTAVSDKAAPCPLDHVNRRFRAPAPTMPQAPDFTHAATFEAVEYATLEWVGSTTGACRNPSVTSLPSKPNNATTPCRTSQPWPHNLN